MRSIKYIIFSLIFLLIAGCISQFIPETDENQELVVVEGFITDQYEIYTIKLSMSRPLSSKNIAKPLSGCIVTISDNLHNSYMLTETTSGTYATDPTQFQGMVGRKYTLNVKTNSPSTNNYSYESLPVEMKPVPQIDSIFYEKITIKEKDEFGPKKEGCQIYLNTHDPAGICRYYRWVFTETWEFRLPFNVTNSVCWLTRNSSVINIKSTSVLAEDRINRYPLNFISNKTDRLKVRYSVLVNQYSLNEDEYIYWEKLQNISEEVGSLYDITPATVSGNIQCIEDPGEKVLGYFSVSAKSSRRIFIKENFSGIVNLYKECITDTVFGTGPIPHLNTSVWILEDHTIVPPIFRVLTQTKGCADCTVRGTNIEPDFWEDN